MIVGIDLCSFFPIGIRASILLKTLNFKRGLDHFDSENGILRLN